MRVLACTRTQRPEYDADGVEFVPFQTLLAESDVLSLHCPATPETRGRIDGSALAQMKPGAILLNTARAHWWTKPPLRRPCTTDIWVFMGQTLLLPSPCPRTARCGRSLMRC